MGGSTLYRVQCAHAHIQRQRDRNGRPAKTKSKVRALHAGSQNTV